MLTHDRSDPSLRLQIGFDFDPRVPRRRAREELRLRIDLAARALAAHTNKLCAIGHCAIPEPELLRTVQQATALDRDLLWKGLRRCVRDRVLARETIEETTLVFPSALRDCEITVARCARQLGEGPSLVTPERGVLEKFALLATPNPYHSVEVVSGVLGRLRTAGHYPVLLAPGADAANWYRYKLSQSVMDLYRWTAGDANHSFDAFAGTGRHVLIVLDASRLGVEQMSACLEAASPTACVLLIGDLKEAPSSGVRCPSDFLRRVSELQQEFRRINSMGAVEYFLSPSWIFHSVRLLKNNQAID